MKMKSVLVSMLALAAVFSSCSKDGETPGQGGPGAITGDTYLSVALGGSRSARTYAANTAASGRHLQRHCRQFRNQDC